MASQFRTDESCLFCRIIAGEIPSDRVHEGERMIAFRDIAPKAPLHVLIVPRDHLPNAAATAAEDPALIGELIGCADTIARENGHEAYNLLFNTGEAAGQTIFHTHLHLLAGGKLTDLPV
ncbi:HIT domain-containing protein [Nocardioides sp. Kera G14]|uniref:HIT domain-containing protein n=1 Tax=Nocardioides sp. Kera G14 TaxID=2884264 RepID=UPI001D121815|nr:HIT domain-containing protein [Nocardioides sp. Kera G14]UDY24833.1 HIT domain-containing protein [Nocardioides sp. Kera G14]